jgi:hypothetical protein
VFRHGLFSQFNLFIKARIFNCIASEPPFESGNIFFANAPISPNGMSLLQRASAAINGSASLNGFTAAPRFPITSVSSGILGI